MGKTYEYRYYVAVGSLGNFDACALDYYRLTDAANEFNQDEDRLTCARDLFRDAAELDEEYGFSPEMMARFNTITGGVYPFLRVHFNYQPDKLPSGALDDLATRFNLRLYQAGCSEDYPGDMFSGRYHPTPAGVENHPELRVLRSEGHDMARAALQQAPTFRPFGIQLGTDGQVQLCGIDHAQLTDDQRAEALWLGLRRTARADHLVSVAVVRITESNNRDPELTTHLEHRLGMAIAVVDQVEIVPGRKVRVDAHPKRVEMQALRVFESARS